MASPHPEAPLPAPGLPRRLAAIVYDTLLVIPLIMVSAAVAMGVRQLVDPVADVILPPWVVQGIAVFCCIGFFGVFWMKSGQTLGMQAWRIKLVPAPGRDLTFGRVVTRCVSALLSFACFGAGYLWCLIDPNKRTWHDHLSGTELVLLPKAGKKAGADPSDASGATQEQHADDNA